MFGLLQEHMWLVYTPKRSRAAGRHRQADLGGPGWIPATSPPWGCRPQTLRPGLQAPQSQAESGEAAATRTRPLLPSDESWEPWSLQVAIGTFRGGSEVFQQKSGMKGAGLWQQEAALNPRSGERAVPGTAPPGWSSSLDHWRGQSV